MITLLIFLAVCGILLWLFGLINAIDPTVKTAIRGIILFIMIIGAILIILDVFDWYHFPLKKLLS